MRWRENWSYQGRRIQPSVGSTLDNRVAAWSKVRQYSVGNAPCCLQAPGVVANFTVRDKTEDAVGLHPQIPRFPAIAVGEGSKVSVFVLVLQPFRDKGVDLGHERGVPSILRDERCRGDPGSDELAIPVCRPANLGSGPSSGVSSSLTSSTARIGVRKGHRRSSSSWWRRRFSRIRSMRLPRRPRSRTASGGTIPTSSATIGGRASLPSPSLAIFTVNTPFSCSDGQ